jgi:sulfonate transport system substrate-binding protein
MIARRHLLAGTAALATGLTTIRRSRAAPSVLRIGYQKNGSLLILKQHRTLEQRLGSAGVQVAWVEFNSGPPMLEALNADGIDIGATGDMPPLFAQAAGADLVYIAYQPAPGRNSAVLVHADGPIKTIADLKGARVAFTKGSSAHNVIVRVLQKAGLTYGDIHPVYLQPPDATAAFRQGAVDAWSIWDPFYAIAERDPNTRVLTSALGVAPSNSFFIARRAFANQDGVVVSAVVEEITKVTTWIGTHQDEVARVMADATGVPEDIQRVTAARGSYDTGLMTDAVAAQQQAIADTFLGLGLLPRAIRVRDAIWTPRA